ncbi:MAG TPA: hypothetical protein VNY31_02560 [Solirubrobacteraceae bacterium]|nr:hypothetical protein [Solirubrobacteraceae bacterium]
MKNATIALALGGVALTGLLSGCETTAEKSARLERTAHHNRPVERGLTIAKRSADVHVLSAMIVHAGEGNAAVVTLRNNSGHTLKGVPIAITVKDARGGTLFQNNAPGLEAALTSLASLPAHGEATWIDDQVQASGAPARVSAIAGEAPTASGSVPRIEVQSVHLSEEGGGTGAAGTVRNRSKVTQQNLVVYVLARRTGRIVAAGRAVLPEVAAGASLPFQAFFVGSPNGGNLEASAPATTLG